MGTGAAFAVAGAGAVTGNSRAANEAAASIQRYVRLGRTELQVSDISFGSSSNSDPDVVARAFDRGVNYFDSAESYRWGGAEEAIGKALKGRRDKVILTSKTKAGASESRSEIMKSLEDSLRRLQTDYVDIYFNHSVNDVDRLRNQEWLEFAELAKRQGKIRFRGVSGHGSRLAECIDYTLDNDIADVICDSAGVTAPAGESEAERRRCRGDEDADGSPAQRHAAIRATGRDILAGRFRLGAVRSERR
jgi:hypothetical protein